MAKNAQTSTIVVIVVIEKKIRAVAVVVAFLVMPASIA
jgi:hypothetical protein